MNTGYVEETFEGLEEQGDRSEIYLGLGAPSFRDTPTLTARQLAKSDPNRRHISLVNTGYVEETF